jgi:hypothetical protein
LVGIDSKGLVDDPIIRFCVDVNLALVFFFYLHTNGIRGEVASFEVLLERLAI